MLEVLKEIPTGYRGTEATIAEMKRLVEEDAKKFALIKLASDIVADEPERDQNAECAAILLWIQTNIRFVRDPYNIEMVQAPEYTVMRGAGDCDDMSTLFNCLCKCIGYDTAFKTVKADPRIPTEFSHVYSLVGINGKWVPADPSQKGRALGWEPPRHLGAQIWGYSRGKLQKSEESPNMAGLETMSLEQRTIAFFRRGQATKAAAKAAAANPEPAPFAQQPASMRQELDDQSQRDFFLDEGAGDSFDPDDMPYYGAYGGDENPPGGFTMERFEEIDTEESEVNDLSPLKAPVSGPASDYAMQMMRRKRLGVNPYDKNGLNLSVRQQQKMGT